MTTLNIAPTPLHPLQSPSPNSNGVTYKWIAGILLGVLLAGLPILWSAITSAESPNIGVLRERVASLEVNAVNLNGKIDLMRYDLRELDAKIDKQFEEVIRRLERESRRSERIPQ